MAPRNTRVTPETQVRTPARSFVQSLDTFYAPARDRRGEESVQRGLNAFSSIVGERAAQLKQEQRSDEFNQGVLDAMREEAGQELKGVQTGSIFRQHSKYYTAGLQETKGKAAASRFKTQFALEYEEWAGKNEDPDGSLFREFMNERIGTFISGLGDNEYAVSGALPIINEVANNYATQHTAFVNQRLEEESWQAYDDIVAGVFDGFASGEYDMETVVDRLAFEADDMYISEGAAANDRLVQAAIRYANTHNDPDALLALARGHDAGKLKLSVTNQEKIANAMDSVEADIQRNLARDNARTDAEEKARRRALLDNWGKVLQDDPYAPMPDWEDVGDYTTYTQMQTLSKTFQEAGRVENPTITASKRMRLEADLFEAGSTAEKLGVINEFASGNPGALSASDISKYTREILESADPNSIVNNPTVGKFRDGFGQMLGSFQTDEYNIDTVSVMRTYGQRYFDEYMMSVSGDLNVTDPRALRVAIKEAEQYAMEQLAFEFPDIMAERNASKPDEGRALGADEALQNRQNVLDQQAAAEFAKLAGVDPAAVTEGTPEGTDPAAPAEPLPGAEAAPDGDLPIEEQPAPFEDPDNEEAYTPTRNGFYGQLIQRFTDGVDTRSKGHTAVEAAKVLQDDPEFAAALGTLADDLDVSPGAIMAVMDFETGGTFSTDVRNAAGSGATGLIQFMPATARALGTTTEALAGMTRAQQMVYVTKYFKQFEGRIRGGDIDDVYMAVLYPKAIGKPDGYALFREGTIAYKQNAGLDTNKDGVVTKFEAAAKVRSRYYG